LAHPLGFGGIVMEGVSRRQIREIDEIEGEFAEDMLVGYCYPCSLTQSYNQVK